MSLITELSCNVVKADFVIIHNLYGPTVKPIAYFTVQNNDTIALPLTAQEQIIVFNPIDNSAPVTANLTIDASASKIGDQVTIMASVTNVTLPGAFIVKLKLPPQMYFAQCGVQQPQTSNEIFLNYTVDTVVHTFTFDGTQFVCGYDNC
jgi:hypothetical protein